MYFLEVISDMYLFLNNLEYKKDKINITVILPRRKTANILIYFQSVFYICVFLLMIYISCN